MAPLRDRAPSNEPESISAMEPQWPNSATTPLRISKRDSPLRQHPSQLSRRASNTINRLKSSSLVSHSPFLSTKNPTASPSRPSSTIGAPSPRRVSGEKRQRPHSIHAQAENEKPFGYKRERRQSKGYQGLVADKPVTKSPFRQPSSTRVVSPTLPPPPAPPSPPPPPPKPARLPTPTSSGSPARSSLVSKRFHGPRILGHEISRRQRRKTVTFDPNCDVLEFEVDEEMEEEPFLSSDDESMVNSSRHDHEEFERATTDDIGTDLDDSITGLVDSMLYDARPQTPPQEHHLPPDLETEDGVPYGRSHHAERIAAQRGHLQTPPDSSSDQPQSSPSTTVHNHEFHETRTTPSSVSPRNNIAETPAVQQAANNAIQMVPPSSHNTTSKLWSSDNSYDSTAKVTPEVIEDIDHEDPFANDDVQVVELSFMSSSDIQEELDRSIQSLGHSDVSYSALEAELGLTSDPNPVLPTRSPVSTPPLKTRNSGSFGRKLPEPPHGYSASPRNSTAFDDVISASMAREVSPMPATSTYVSPASTLGHEKSQPSEVKQFSAGRKSSVVFNASSGYNPEVPKEDLRHTIHHTQCAEDLSTGHLGRRSDEIMREVESQGDLEEHDAANSTQDMSLVDDQPRPSLLRRGENYTHDGVLSLDPEPQPIDPPRPSMLSRAVSTDNELERDYAAPASGFRGLQFNLSTGSGLGLGVDFSERVEIGEVKSALDKLVEDVTSDSAPSVSSHNHHANEKTKVFSVLGVARPRTPTNMDEPVDYTSDDTNDSDDERAQSPTPALLQSNSFMSPTVSRNVSVSSSQPPPPPPKDAIKSREQAILQKRREMRRQEEDEAMGRITPPRRSKRRSMNVADVEPIKSMRPMGPDRDSPALADFAPVERDTDLEGTISRELRKRNGGKNKYNVREHEMIYASADADRTTHIESAGDADNDKAWRTVRRPSDMNEYAKQIREYRAQEKPGKGHGKVFVRVVGVRGLDVPMPQQATAFTCTLNNGIHFVTTPDCRLSPDCRIEQEFELIEHSKLEFTLSLKVRKDPHIVVQFKANAPPPPPVPVQQSAPTPASKGGVRSFFSSSPKKNAKSTIAQQVIPPVHRLEENLARYLKPDGTLARAFVCFREIANRCDTRLFETTFPLIGHRLEPGGKSSSLQVGELVLQFFRLPPLPGVPPAQLPQSLDECHRGLRHVHWHKMTYYEGILTQNGGDCVTWRRRHFRIIGANLVAFNDVTKRATASIDLRKATAIEDLQDPNARLLTPASSKSVYDEYDLGVERSFRVTFKGDDEIVFFADSDEEKARWLDVLRALIGHIPSNPLWAELLWQRQQELCRNPPAPTATPAVR